MSDVTIDFVAFDDDRNACLLVLVEEAWTTPIDDNLRALQSRLYGCLNAALDGQLAQMFPKSLGRTIIIQVDCYDLPKQPVDEFIERFSKGISQMSDYSPEGSLFFRAFEFQVEHGTLSNKN